MNARKRVAVAALTIAVGFTGLELGDEFSIPGVHGVVSEAQAVVGHPLTPLSGAGVARRTTRRAVRRTGVRLNTLPAGCVYGAYYGAHYYNCRGVYYQKSGTVYIQVVIE
jgi:hypothetical protein